MKNIEKYVPILGTTRLKEINNNDEFFHSKIMIKFIKFIETMNKDDAKKKLKNEYPEFEKFIEELDL